MCGILGIINYGENISRNTVRTMLDTMEKRGPDGSGIEFVDSIVMGHRRLSIIDLTDAGSQPMRKTVKGKDCLISFNGEIYNYIELKKELSAKGHTFESKSDTEVIINAYAEWGEDCLNKFNGMFSFALYDRGNAKVFCAVDPMGEKPFYYCHTSQATVFASDMRPFYKCPFIKKEVNESAIGLYLQFKYFPYPGTALKGIEKLEAGSTLSFSLDKSCMPVKKKYFDPAGLFNISRSYTLRSYEDSRQRFEEELLKSVKIRMRSDVPYGVLLSSGVDSSLIACMMSKISADPVKAFTISYENSNINEASYASKLAEHLGLDHKILTMTEKEILDQVYKIPDYYSEPFSDSSAIPTMMVSMLTKKYVTVALGGDGGDELLYGYRYYKLAEKFNTLRNFFPGVLKKTLLRLARLSGNDMIRKSAGAVAFSADEIDVFTYLSNPFKDFRINDLIPYSNMKRSDIYRKYANEKLSGICFNDKMMLLDLEYYLPGDILTKTDRASMTYSLELRSPFLDRNLVAFLLDTPFEYKFRRGVTKRIARDLLTDMVPAHILNTKKLGFSIPLYRWIKGELNDYFVDNIVLGNKWVHNFVKKSAIEEMMNLTVSGKRNFADALWGILQLQMWYYRWMK